MLYKWRLILSALSFSCLLSHEKLVSAGRIPTRQVEEARRDVDTAAVELSNLGIFQQYVCPKSTNLLKRQSTTITVPKSELRGLLLQIRLLELQLIDILLEDGTEAGSGNPTDIAVPAFLTGIVSSSTTTTVPLASLGSAVDSVLSSLTSSTDAPSSTLVLLTTIDESGTPIIRTVRVTRTTTATTITITASPGLDTTPNVAAPSTTAAPLSDFTDTTTVADFDTTTSLPVDLDTSLAESLTPTDAPTTTSGFPKLSSTFPEITASQGSSEMASPPPTTTTLPGGGFIEISSTGSPTAAVPTPTSPAADYTFNALSQRNIAVYFGQTAITGTTSLEAQCADPNIDIVILAFVISQLSGGIYPSVNFGAACGGQTDEMRTQAPGLLSCPELAGNISTCQNTYGKKVLMSVGGATSQISFGGEDQARNFGDVLWNLFGPAGNIDDGLRPFGDIEVDGFDIDKEDRQPAYFGTIATTLRSHYATHTAKNYYLSSAPQCPFPDASTPLDLLLLCDFVFVQFYNNPPCEIGSTGFAASVDQWSSALEASTMAVKPRLYIGAPAFAEAGQSAYANIGSAEGMKGVAQSVKEMNVPNLGGVMFWDGPMGMANIGGGLDIIAWAKEGLES
ncbi:glycoside hydrolase superfamily [Rhexocercosporidium sp. MPI-PUGE-AT-0058]|nr:glycoside hydrolase superfamily [Rhexocercosporidium sp. MPI-PUGE-AT-0058]